MIYYFEKMWRSLGSKLIVITGLILFIGISTWAYFNIRYYESRLKEGVMANADRLTTTIRLGTHYAMMLNSRNDINQIINNISQQQDIQTIRIYNKDGQIKYSSIPSEIDQITNIRDEACHICHHAEPPLEHLDINERTRFFYSKEGKHLLGIITPIYNEPTCRNSMCHFHPVGKKVLGALDLVISMESTDHEIKVFENAIIVLAIFILTIMSAAIFWFVSTFVHAPIQGLIKSAKLITKGDYTTTLTIERDDEIGELAAAFNHMKSKIFKKELELNRQRDEYQTLFEGVPCIITVQDKDYKLINYNREFTRLFNPKPGDFCYAAYKGRTDKCPVCPVEKTFEDGQSHYSEEKSIKDGQLTHWVVRTAPIRNSLGEIVAAMEISLDVTRSKLLEDQVEKTEKKYFAIFNNMPIPVFLLDADSLTIIDCNESVKTVYGYERDEMIGMSFLELFKDTSTEYCTTIRTSSMIPHVRHVAKDERIIFVNIRISPMEYPGQKVLLVSTSDITKRLEAEQQVIQAGKMATLGEMATGVAHELNQPLTVIKTASTFLMKKVKKNQEISPDILLTMSTEIDSHVDRATKIINHMRQFGRKSDLTLEKIQINDVLTKAFGFFGQQLKLRGIEVVWQLDEHLPQVMADADRLEQVFINLFINARDAIEEKCLSTGGKCDKKITLITRCDHHQVIIEVIDTGTGIPEHLLEKIFEPFFTTKKVGQGTGLGLSITYGIVKDCGGNIRALSKPGEGATFVITFPIPDREPWKTQIYV